MPRSHGRMKRTPEERRVKLSIRLTRELYDRMRAVAMSKGFLTIAEWARAAVISAVAK